MEYNHVAQFIQALDEIREAIDNLRETLKETTDIKIDVPGIKLKGLDELIKK